MAPTLLVWPHAERLLCCWFCSVCGLIPGTLCIFSFRESDSSKQKTCACHKHQRGWTDHSERSVRWSQQFQLQMGKGAHCSVVRCVIQAIEFSRITSVGFIPSEIGGRKMTLGWLWAVSMERVREEKNNKVRKWSSINLWCVRIRILPDQRHDMQIHKISLVRNKGMQKGCFPSGRKKQQSCLTSFVHTLKESMFSFSSTFMLIKPIPNFNRMACDEFKTGRPFLPTNW